MEKDVVKMSFKHESLLRAQIEGKNTVEICREFDITEDILRVYRSDVLWKTREGELREELHSDRASRLQTVVGKAIAALDELVDSPDDALRLRAAESALDRGGFPKGVKVEVDNKPVINLFLPEHLKPKVVEAIEVGGVAE